MYSRTLREASLHPHCRSFTVEATRQEGEKLLLIFKAEGATQTPLCLTHALEAHIHQHSDLLCAETDGDIPGQTQRGVAYTRRHLPQPAYEQRILLGEKFQEIVCSYLVGIPVGEYPFEGLQGGRIAVFLYIAPLVSTKKS